MHIKWPPIAFMAWDICPQYNISKILALMHSMLEKENISKSRRLAPLWVQISFLAAAHFLDKPRMNRQGRSKGKKFANNALSFTFPKIILKKGYGVQLCLLRMMRWSAYQSWSPSGQESDRIIGNHFDIWHSELTEYIHINLWCGFWQGGVRESLQIRMWSNSIQQNLSVTPFIVILICHDIVILAMSAIHNCQYWYLCVFVPQISRQGWTRGSNIV